MPFDLRFVALGESGPEFSSATRGSLNSPLSSQGSYRTQMQTHTQLDFQMT